MTKRADMMGTKGQRHYCRAAGDMSPDLGNAGSRQEDSGGGRDDSSNWAWFQLECDSMSHD
jgi:hypothetical protein